MRLTCKRGQESRLPSKAAFFKTSYKRGKALNAAAAAVVKCTLIYVDTEGRGAILTDFFRWISRLGPWVSSGRLRSSLLACCTAVVP